MSDLNPSDWLKIAAVVPSVVAAWKLPTLWNWVKMRYANAVAAAVMQQLTPQLAEMRADLSLVKYQVFPNGGGSMSDQLNRVLALASSTERTVLVLRDTMRAHQDADVMHVRFEADTEGLMTWASHSLQRWCAKSVDQVLRYGWINCVAHDDREMVREQWNKAISEQRELSLRFRMIDVRGEEFPVEMLARPLRSSGAIQNWVGVIVKTG